MSTKNVFAELGFDLESSTVEAWRSDLARIIRDCFSRSQKSQDAFARQLGIKQSVVSRVINGRIQNYSVEYLLRLCIRLQTRGFGSWGPTADEAQVTTDVSAVTGTATFRPTFAFATEGFAFASSVQFVRTKQSVAASQSSIAKIH